MYQKAEMASEAQSLLKSTDDSEVETKEEGPIVCSNERQIVTHKVPLGTWILEKIGLCRCYPNRSHKVLVYILTFLCYTTYHLSRKPFSVVKVVLCPDCANSNKSDDDGGGGGWPPFNGDNGNTLLGAVDYSWLFAYAIAMFFSGQIADRVNLRFFLTFGMIGSGVSVALLGVAYFAEIHHLAYFIAVQLLGGVMQSTGWPGVVAVMGNWFGKQRRGFIMGIWNSHTSVGNILGTIIPSFWATTGTSDPPWGWAFIVPAFIIAGMGVIIFMFLVTDPQHVGLHPPVHHLRDEVPEEQTQPSESSQRNGHLPDLIPRSGPRDDTEEKQGLDNGGIMEEKDGRKEESEERRQIQSGDQPGQGDPHSGGEQPQSRKAKKKAVGFFKALMIPGVVEFSLALFFNKLVSYTFLFWLPFYVKYSHPDLSGEEADWLSTLFDVGGIIGGIVTGLVSDWLRARAVVCVSMLICAIPSLFCLQYFGDDDMSVYIIFLIVCGAFINGPYAIITTAVSSDLGTHRSLKENQNAKATVTAIIDGTGSLGAAFGPLIIGWITDEHSWKSAFYVLMGSTFLAAVFLTRLFVTEVMPWFKKLRKSRLLRHRREEREQHIELQELVQD